MHNQPLSIVCINQIPRAYRIIKANNIWGIWFLVVACAFPFGSTPALFTAWQIHNLSDLSGIKLIANPFIIPISPLLAPPQVRFLEPHDAGKYATATDLTTYPVYRWRVCPKEGNPVPVYPRDGWQ
jgi:hypothetical protein